MGVPKVVTVITVVVLYFIFSIASALAGLWGVLTLAGGVKRISTISQSMDRTLAAMLGWDGRETVSKECGRDSGTFCSITCWTLDKVLEKNHCTKEQNIGVS